MAAAQSELDLGLDAAGPSGGDEIFRHLVLARIIEPVGKLDSIHSALMLNTGG
jgi:hypothetical protein